MKCYLSSYQTGSETSSLTEMISGDRRIGVIRNALDFSNDRSRLEEGRKREFADLQKCGIKPEPLDLREYFGKPEELAERVSSLDGLWATGGNTFLLRKAYAKSGLDELLFSLKSNEKFFYGGYSAGVCVLTKTLKGIHLVDDPEVEAEGYDGEVVWEGLGLLPFSIAPHYKSEHPESALIEETVRYFIANKIPFIALRDGEVYIDQIK